MRSADRRDYLRARSRPSLHLLLLASLSAVVALIAFGCGDPSEEERFVEQVCATIMSSAEELLQAGEDVIHTPAAPGSDARVELLSLAMRGTGITASLRAELAALLPPSSDVGAAAKQYVESVARLAFETTAAEERRVRALPLQITLAESINGLELLEVAYAQAYTQVKSVDLIGASVPEMKEPFENADSCQALRALQPD